MLTVLGEAERFGAVSRTGSTYRAAPADGRACGVQVRDTESGEEFEVRAANVVNATGVWADQLRPQELHVEAELPSIRPSRGTHITIQHADLPLVGGAIVPAGSGRSIFALPWLGHTLIGTTDNDYEGPLEHVEPSTDDIGYLLDAVNAFFGTDFGPEGLTGAFAGVRPLISTGDPKKSVDISRKAELYETSSGMITITGGKLTTWRRMAKMTVDRLVLREAREAALPHPRNPARPGDLARGAAARSRASPTTPTRRSPRATATPRSTCCRSRASAASSPSRSSETALTCSQRSRSPPGTSRRAASATCCCAAPASGCSPPGSSTWAASPAPAVRRVGDVLARELGWDERRLARRARRFAARGGCRGARPAVHRRPPSPHVERAPPAAARVRARTLELRRAGRC